MGLSKMNEKGINKNTVFFVIETNEMLIGNKKGISE
jgi:hypothetical protein